MTSMIDGVKLERLANYYSRLVPNAKGYEAETRAGAPMIPCTACARPLRGSAGPCSDCLRLVADTLRDAATGADK